MRSFFKNITLNEKGSQLIEQAIVFPLFMLLIVGFFDVSRFLTTETLLTKGAYDAAMLASRLPNIDTDLRGLDTSSNEYKRFKIARDMIIKEARKLPIATIVGEAGSVDPVRLLKFDMADVVDTQSAPTPGIRAGNTPSAPTPGIFDAAVLRPGDCALVASNKGAPRPTVNCASDCIDGNPDCFSHPTTLPPQSTGTAYNTNQKKLMENELMMVVLKSEVEMMLPGLGTMQAQGVGVARRQALPFSPFERAIEGNKDNDMDVDYNIDPPTPVNVDSRAPVVRPNTCGRAVVLQCSLQSSASSPGGDPNFIGIIVDALCTCPTQRTDFYTSNT